jgi:hypothetical protein
MVPCSTRTRTYNHLDCSACLSSWISSPRFPIHLGVCQYGYGTLNHQASRIFGIRCFHPCRPTVLCARTANSLKYLDHVCRWTSRLDNGAPPYRSSTATHWDVYVYPSHLGFSCCRRPNISVGICIDTMVTYGSVTIVILLFLG